MPRKIFLANERHGYDTVSHQHRDDAGEIVEHKHGQGQHDYIIHNNWPVDLKTLRFEPYLAWSLKRG